jgi:hypothetical protein
VFELIIYRLFPIQVGVSAQITFGARTFQLFLKLRFVSQTNGKLLCLSYLAIIFSLALVVSLASCQKSGLLAQKTTYELVGEAKVVPGNYGNVVKGADVVTTATLLQTVESAGTFTGKVSGNIKEVCTNKGCWFAMELPNGSKMRVTFKDYGFFIPTNSQGFPITIEGVATLSETDVETLRHYAEDQGKSKEEVEAITAPKKEITFEASGALIKAKI